MNQIIKTIYSLLINHDIELLVQVPKNNSVRYIKI